MKPMHWNYTDKSTWGPGPWQEEPDKIQWTDQRTGLPCLVVRSETLGNWCGYVGVPEGHPLHGKHYYHHRLRGINVHGGLTFSNTCGGKICHVREDGDPEVWWFGFDCAHWMDFSPGLAALEVMRIPGLSFAPPDNDCVYRDLPYVQAECISLAKQLVSKSRRRRA